MERSSALTANIRSLLRLSLILALIATGCDSSDEASSIVDDSESPVAPASAATDAGASAPPAPAPASGPAVGHSLVLSLPTPLYAEPAASEGAPAALRVRYYVGNGASYRILNTRGEWCAVDSPDGEARLPCWYGTPEAGAAEETSPIELTPKPDALLALFPGSAAAWPAAGHDRLLSALTWNGWHAVVVPAAAVSDSETPLPALLWIRAQDIAADTAPDGSGGSGSERLRLLAETLLPPGTTRERTAQLLGEPDVREASHALNMTDEPLRVGASWRYERQDGQLTASFDERGLLQELRWTLPYAHAEQTSHLSYRSPHRVYEFRTLPLTPSRAPDWQWRSEGTLAHIYLLHASDDTLLLLGDDGGFSGMHYYSNLAGVDRESGELRWQLDTGYAGIAAVPVPGGERLTVLTRIDKETGEHVNRLRHLGLRDGAPRWERVLPKEREFVALHGVRGAVVTSSQPFQDESDGHLRVWDADTGQLRWERSYEQPYALLNEGGGDPYILLLQVDTLQAIDPKSGKTIWTLRGLGATDPDLSRSPFAAPRTDPFDADGGVRWITLGVDRYLINVSDGKVQARYRIVPGELVEAVDNRYWLIQRPLDDDRYWMASEFDTVLYDTATGKTLWTLPGRIGGSLLEGDTLLAIYDGLPTAIEWRTGRIKWQTEGTGAAHEEAPPPSMLLALRNGTVLVMAGWDIVALDLRDGRILYRLADTVVGYTETHGEYVRSHLAAEAPDGSLYLGSANGRFSRLRLPQPSSLPAG